MSMDPSGVPGSAPAASDPAAALIDVRTQLLRLGQQIAEMRAEPGGAGVDAANGVIAELREAVRFLAERLDGVARMVAQRGEELADTRGALSAIDAHVRSQAETIGVLTTGMQALPSYGERVSALQDNINGLQQRLSGIEGAFGPLGQRLGAIETAVSRPDSGVSERLAALEGMVGPMSQRLGQSLAEHSASLQALHARVEALATGTQAGIESIAAGTQAALAAPSSTDDAVNALEPRLASLASDLEALRKEVSALAAAPSPTAPLEALRREVTALAAESPTAALEALRREVAALAAESPTAALEALRRDVAALAAESPTAALGELREQVSTLAAAPPAAASAPAPSGDVDAAVAAAEARIKDHIDDAIIALAQTMLGKARNEAVAAVPPVDEPAPPAAEPEPDPLPPQPLVASESHDDDIDSADSEYDGGVDEADEGADPEAVDTFADDSEDPYEDEAAIDFSAPALAEDEGAPPPIVAWNPQAPAPSLPASDESHFFGRRPTPANEPFDQDAQWDAYKGPEDGGDKPPAPTGRRRWFSW
ncbi:MAG TPA: hypothetical protein VHB69_12765 [Mycobacteriales bacterium]|nr:hypothetical protein [Mycobacteriales bacterium]